MMIPEKIQSHTERSETTLNMSLSASRQHETMIRVVMTAVKFLAGLSIEQFQGAQVFV